MYNILLFAKRELRVFVDTPVGYVVLAVFPATMAALFFLAGSFFAESEATLRNFFTWMPIAMALLVPALTMRMWSEEIREGTEELLLTWPIRLRELVLGKFLGALSLLFLTLLATAMIPMTVAYLGDVDGGVVLAGYCGTFLLGAVCASLGLLLSSLTRNQIVAWLSSAAILIALNLLGLAATARSIPPSLAHALETLDLGLHFYSMSRGVIDAADLLFFLGLTLFFLVCNGLVLERRLRR
ncbi:MAG: ABC transporter permease [Planctomycetota bacterium]|nr:ABC transporter permease [Planctomycetota bacterium]